jgi:hypothetical protein
MLSRSARLLFVGIGLSQAGEMDEAHKERIPAVMLGVARGVRFPYGSGAPAGLDAGGRAGMVCSGC